MSDDISLDVMEEHIRECERYLQLKPTPALAPAPTTAPAAGNGSRRTAPASTAAATAAAGSSAGVITAAERELIVARLLDEKRRKELSAHVLTGSASAGPNTPATHSTAARSTSTAAVGSSVVPSTQPQPVRQLRATQTPAAAAAAAAAVAASAKPVTRRTHAAVTVTDVRDGASDGDDDDPAYRNIRYPPQTGATPAAATARPASASHVATATAPQPNRSQPAAIVTSRVTASAAKPKPGVVVKPTAKSAAAAASRSAAVKRGTATAPPNAGLARSSSAAALTPTGSSSGGVAFDDRVRHWTEAKAAELERRERVKQNAEKARLSEFTFKPQINPPSPKRGASASGADGTTPRSTAQAGSIASMLADPNIFDASEEPADGEQPQPSSETEPVLTAADRSRIVEAVTDRLYEPSNIKVQIRERARQQLEEQRLSQHSFQPHINPNSRRRIEGGSGAAGAGSGGAASGYRPPHTRIGDEQKRRVALLTELATRREQEIKQELTFTPKINALSVALTERQRREAAGAGGDGDRSIQLAIANGDTSGSGGMSLVPVMSDSLLLAATPQSKAAQIAATTARLASNTGRSTEAKLAREQKLRADTESEMTFRPAISATTDAIVSRLHPFKSTAGGTGVVERQAVYDELRKSEHVVRTHQIIAETDQCSFRPDIGNASRVLANSRFSRHHNQLMETKEQRIERMAVHEAEHQNSVKQQLAEDYYSGSEFAFKPALSLTSRALARRRSLSDLMREASASGSRAPAVMEAHRAADEAFRAAHTFKPNLLTKHKHVTVTVAAGGDDEPTAAATDAGGEGRRVVKSGLVVDGSLITDSRYKLIDASDPASIIEKVHRYQTEKESRIAAKQAQKAADEMKECTFQPTRINAQPKSKRPATAAAAGTAPAPAPVRVHGLDRFLELKEMAAKMAADKRARQSAVFDHHKHYAGDQRPFTVPQPFKLATSDPKSRAAQGHDSRRKQLLARVQTQRMAECTFQPKTVQRTNREMIRQILAESDDAEAADLPPPAPDVTYGDIDAGDDDDRSTN